MRYSYCENIIFSFNHKNPEDANEVPNGFLSDVNANSKQVITAFADEGLEQSIKSSNKLQFERIGFFSVDPDTKPGNVRKWIIFYNYF